MVSKVAVIALVAIVACPILLGYAMNLNEITVIEYESNNDPMNVTQLLQTGTDWSITNGDVYQINSNAQAEFTSSNDLSCYPVFNTISTVKTSVPMVSDKILNWNGGFEPRFNQFLEYQMWCNYNVNNGQTVTMRAHYDGGSVTSDYSNVIFARWSATTEKLTLILSSNYDDSTHLSKVTLTIPNMERLDVDVTNGPVGIFWTYVENSSPTGYADISDGYYFQKYSNQPKNWGWDIKMPDNTISALLSINLDSITDANYTMKFEDIGTYGVELTKTTTAGVVSWQLTKLGQTYDLYYNPDISDNTYQVLLTDTSGNGGSYEGHMQFRYVGHWQKNIGEAHYYQTYDLDYDQTIAQGNTLDSISIVANDAANSRTPTIRIDAAQFRGYEYPVIQGSLDPAAFKSNPSTKISDIETYGNQIIFGGNTYNVKNGNITIGTHQIPVKNMVFSSVPDDDTLQYNNMINGTVISTSATPSTIQFVGKWSGNVTITSMQQTTHVETQWEPGVFAWDGLDHNFLIVGLIASLGAFIGVGIYARRTKTGLWPLMIVCGGAAVLFFIML